MHLHSQHYEQPKTQGGAVLKIQLPVAESVDKR